MAELPKGRKLANRSGQSISVKDHEATGDGTTDDSAFVQAANDAVAGGDLHFPSGTYIIDGITGAKGRWILAKDAIIKHKASSSSTMVEAIADFSLSGGAMDGNKSNQSNRIKTLNFTGDNLNVDGCHISNTIRVGIGVDNADTVSIRFNRFTDIGEHGGVLGETANAIFVDTSTSIARTHITHNFFVNGTPVASDQAPTAVQFSAPVDTTDDTVIDSNTIIGFGTRFTGNPTACIEIYKDVNGVIVTNNTIEDYHWTGIRVTDSSEINVSNNVIRNAASTLETGSAALSCISLNHGSPQVSKNNFVVSGNVIDNEHSNGMYISGGNATFRLERAVVSNNLITRAGESGIFHAFTAGEILNCNNVIHECGTNGIRLDDCTGSVDLIGNIIKDPTGNGIDIEDATGNIKISGGRITDSLASGISARTTITSLDLAIEGVTVDTAATFGFTCRDLNSLKVTGCIYEGAAPSSADFDMSNVTEAYVTDCSWQKVQEAKTATYAFVTGDFGRTFTNEGAGGSFEFDIPIATSLPLGWNIRLIVLAAQQVDIDPNVVDRIFPTTNADGDRLRNAGNIGENVTIEKTHADGFSIVSEKGTWTDAS